MRKLALLACALAFVSTPSFAQDKIPPPAQIAGGAAGYATPDPVAGWPGPNAVDFTGGAASDSIGHLAYAADRKECGYQVGTLPNPWDIAGIARMTGQGAVQGAAAGAPAAAINPIAVAFTAIAAAGSALVTGITNNLGWFSSHDKAQISVCMDRRSIKSGMYTVTDTSGG